MGKRYFYQSPEGDQSTGGDGGDKGAVVPFADAAAARGFLKEWVPSEDYVKPFDDAKVIPFATHLKTRVDEMGKAFPGNWREQLAAGNAEHLKTLERFKTPVDLYGAYGALRQKMSSGELRPVVPFPEKGSPEEQQAWRTTNGIPESPEGYKFQHPKDFQVDGDDKQIFDSLAKTMHAGHIAQPQAQAFVNWFHEQRTARLNERVDADLAFKNSGEDALRAKWGPDYRPNMNRVEAFFASAPAGLSEKINSARYGDGTRVAFDPAFLEMIVDVSRQTNPAGVTLPGQGGTLAQSVETEILNLEKFMATDRETYNKDEKSQARLRELYGAYEKMKGHTWDQRPKNK